MTELDIELQAEKLIAFIKKGGSKSYWFKSKGFTAVDREAIEIEYKYQTNLVPWWGGR